jgi:hypothetical protein
VMNRFVWVDYSDYVVVVGVCCLGCTRVCSIFEGGELAIVKAFATVLVDLYA